MQSLRQRILDLKARRRTTCCTHHRRTDAALRSRRREDRRESGTTSRRLEQDRSSLERMCFLFLEKSEREQVARRSVATVRTISTPRLRMSRCGKIRLVYGGSGLRLTAPTRDRVALGCDHLDRAGRPEYDNLPDAPTALRWRAAGIYFSSELPFFEVVYWTSGNLYECSIQTGTIEAGWDGNFRFWWLSIDRQSPMSSTR